MVRCRAVPISSICLLFVSGIVCCSMLAAVPAAAEQRTGHRHVVPAAAASRMSPHDQILHALNRFTFGPRPGDEAKVRQMGLDAWLEQQLHPDTIDDAGLGRRLAKFPAMQLSQTELIERFPTPGMLRQYSRGGLDAPVDPLERAVYADAGLNYERKLNAVFAQKGDAPSKENDTTADKKTMSGKLQGSAPPMDDAAVQAILALAPAARMQRLLALSPEQMQSLRAALKGANQQRLLQGFSPAEGEQVAAMQAPIRVVAAEAEATRLLRDVYSERQLQAVMTDFWLNHFNVYVKKNQNEPYLLPAYEQGTILPHALGRFEDLLVATAQSPAMLVYLDNWTSIGPDSRAAQRTSVPKTGSFVPAAGKKAQRSKGINENYARELMELHTLGVSGGYTQADVIEVAKCFTGWTIERPDQGGTFTFNPNRHEPGSKTVLGQVIPEGGVNEGLAVLHILASSPKTAHFLSQELAERFVSDTPPPALVDRMTAAYLKSDGQISAVLMAMYHSPEFWSTTVRRAKVKTPVEFVASALRAGDAEVKNPVPLIGVMDRLGMPIYGMQTPNGYSWQADAWVSSNALVNRMNFALVLSGNRLPGTRLDWAPLLGADTNPNTLLDGKTEQTLEALVLGQAAAPNTRRAVLEQAKDPTTQRTAEQSFRTQPDGAEQGSAVDSEIAGGGGFRRIRAQAAWPTDAPEAPVATMAGLLLGSPDFQRR